MSHILAFVISGSHGKPSVSHYYCVFMLKVNSSRSLFTPRSVCRHTMVKLPVSGIPARLPPAAIKRME